LSKGSPEKGHQGPEQEAPGKELSIMLEPVMAICNQLKQCLLLWKKFCKGALPFCGCTLFIMIEIGNSGRILIEKTTTDRVEISG
jgi:hypothetical protein